MVTKLRARGARWGAPFLAVLFASALLLGMTSVAGAAANRNVIADGTGTVTCPSGFTVPVATIDVSATKSKGIVSGSVTVRDATFLTNKSGQVRSGTVNANGFTVNAILTTDRCNGSTLPTPANATVTGKCGPGVEITYTDSNGETGQFMGNAACN